MIEIKKLLDIDFSQTSTISFEATVIEYSVDGDGDKRPFRFVLKLEESGEIVNVVSWKFENAPIIKNLVESEDVYKFEASAGTFGNYGPQIRIGQVHQTGKKSNKKVVRKTKGTEKNEILQIIKETFNSDSIYMKFLKPLIIENEKFFEWPAATSIHHNYNGGLAKHSLNVCKQSLASWNIYSGENLDKQLLVAGSLLHDIGKLLEYNLDGSRTSFGNFIPHPVCGADMITKIAIENGIDPNLDKHIVALKHIILSHHGKLEFGAPTKPFILEAHLISKADAMDAGIESGEASLSNLEVGSSSEKGLIALDGGKVFKWK